MNADYGCFVADGGIELHVDTAADPALAEKVWRLKPGWGFA
jgi:hypothetical protein